jgi:uncharacterized membrane protein YbhN (UPF0104 family)
VFFILSVFLVILLVKQITLADIRRLAGKLNLPQFVLLGGLYLLMAYGRGVRLGYVLRDKDHARLTAIAAMHAFLNHIMPFRLGELSLPFLVKKFTSRGLVSGSLSLVVVRLYDAVSIALLSMLSLLVVGSQFSPVVRNILWLFSLLVIAVFLAAFRYLDLILLFAARITCTCVRMLGRFGRDWVCRLEDAAGRMAVEINSFNGVQKYFFLPASSIVVTVANYVLFYCAMIFMGIDIGFFKNMLASLGELASTFLPNTLGSFGTMEAGWAAGYVLCGVSKTDAIATGFVMHGIVLLSGLVISVAGLVYLLVYRKKEQIS